MPLSHGFGIGYALDYGNRNAVLFTIVVLALILSSVALGFFL